MIKVLFFAQVRELVGTDSLTLDASELAAVNQTLTSFEHPVASGDEVAFFPPVTGG